MTCHFSCSRTVLANYRKSFRPSGAKDNPSDAGLMLDILMLHRDKLRQLCLCAIARIELLPPTGPWWSKSHACPDLAAAIERPGSAVG